MVESAVFN